MLDDGVDGVACGARHLRDDGALGADEPVGQRRLAGVGPADDGDVDAVVLRVVPCFGQRLDERVEQVARAVAVNGRDRPGVAQAQRAELPDPLGARGVVDLVGDEEHRHVRATHESGRGLVLGGDAHARVDEEDDGVGLLHRHDRLGADGGLEAVVVRDLHAAGVDEQEDAPVPVGLVIAAVARHPTPFVHDGVAHLGDAVHER